MRRIPFCLAILLAFIDAAGALSQAVLPAKADLTAEFNRLGLIPQVQGSDTCSLHAVASLAEFELAERDPRPNSERSTEFLIWAAKKATGKDHDQAMFYEAVFGLNRFGICREALMPEVGQGRPRHAPSPAALADAKAAEQPLEGPLDQALGPQAPAGRCADAGHQGCLGPRPSGCLRSALAQRPQRLRVDPGAAAQCGRGRP